MLRCTQTRLVIPLYHRRALPVRMGNRWRGNFGAVSRFYDKTCMIEPVTQTKNLPAIDREMVNYVHSNRLRHYWLDRSYSERSDSRWRRKREGFYWRRQWNRKLQKSYIAFMQFKIKKTLEEQANLVTKYGQASVNRALGDPAGDSAEMVKGRVIRLQRQIRAPPTIKPVTRHIVTMQQLHPARFTAGWKQE